MNLDFNFGLKLGNVQVLTESSVNEILFDLFFELKDLNLFQIGFEKFIIHHQPYSNRKVLADAPDLTWQELYDATGCDTFGCLKFASQKGLVRSALETLRPLPT